MKHYFKVKGSTTNAWYCIGKGLFMEILSRQYKDAKTRYDVILFNSRKGCVTNVGTDLLAFVGDKPPQ